MASYINDILTVGLTPEKTMAVIIGADSNNTAGIYIGALSIAEDLASTAYKSSIPGLAVTLSSLENNRLEAIKDLNNPELNNRIDDNTMMSLASDTLSLLAVAALALNPALAALAAISATSMALSAASQSDSTEVSDYWLSVLDKIVDMKNDFDLDSYIDDILNPTSQSEALPGLDDFEYYDPNNPTAKIATLDIYGSTVKQNGDRLLYDKIFHF